MLKFTEYEKARVVCDFWDTVADGFLRLIDHIFDTYLLDCHDAFNMVDPLHDYLLEEWENALSNWHSALAASSQAFLRGDF